MGVNIKREVPALTLEEQEVLNIEARRTSAESALQATSEANKVLQNKMVETQSSIDDGVKVIESNNQEIEKTKQLISDVSELYAQKKQEHEDFKVVAQGEVEKIKETIVSKNKELDQVNANITELNKKHSDTTRIHSDEIKSLVSKRDSVVSEINGLNTSKESVLKTISLSQDELSKIQTLIDSKKEEKTSAESLIETLKVQVESQKKEIEKNNSIILSQVDSIKEKESESSDLDKQIEEKQVEYRSLESKAFGILHREELLNQKEAFIKSQFSRAGISYE